MDKVEASRQLRSALIFGNSNLIAVAILRARESGLSERDIRSIYASAKARAEAIGNLIAA
jgi:hypothetical protein